MEKDQIIPKQEDNIDMSKYSIFKEYMQSLQSVSDQDLETNKTIMALCRKKRAYWDKQPVLKPDEIKQIKEDQAKNTDEKATSKVIVEQKKQDTPTEMTELAEQYIWDSCDFSDTQKLEEVQAFLDKNYVESKAGDFRFAYSMKMLKWSLTPPGYDKDLMIAIRLKSSNKMIGFIAGIVVEIKSEGVAKRMLEINF